MNKPWVSMVVGIVIGALAVVLSTLATTALLAKGAVSTGPAQAAQPTAPLALSVALGPGFTYQGQLKLGGAPVNDVCDLSFGLFSTLTGVGSQVPYVGAWDYTYSTPISNGLFTAEVNAGGVFSTAFNGSELFLETWVKCPATTGTWLPMIPRQKITATPYALYALNGGSKVLTYSVSTESNHYLTATNTLLMTVTVTSAMTETVLVDYGGDIYGIHSDPKSIAVGYLGLSVNGTVINFSEAEAGGSNGTDPQSGLYNTGSVHASIARLMPVVLKPGLNIINLRGRRYATGDYADVSYPWIKVTRP